MSMPKTLSLFVVALTTVTALAGCATDVAPEDSDAVVDEAELSAAGKALIGSYKDDSGSFRGLILTASTAGQGNEFIADVSTGIVCVMAPCPSSERITGTFTAGSKTITFRSTTASNYVKHLLGRYNYVVQGDKLSLFRKGFAQSLEKAPSYCAEASDCYEQNIIHPMCMGGFSCTAENTCAWSCGQWPPPAPNPCEGLSLSACIQNAECQPKFGPSACSTNGICTADMAYKGCVQQAEEVVCLSSGSCAAGEHCSTEDGVCNSYGMLAVCAGTCVPDESP